MEEMNETQERFNRYITKSQFKAAIFHENYEEIREIVEIFPDVLTTEFDHDHTILMYVCTRTQLKLMSFLVELGANINEANRNGWTPLIIAVDRGYSEEQIDILLEKGADVNFCGRFGWTPLMHACSRGKLKIVKHLIKRGANIEMEDHEGKTAFITSCTHDFFDGVLFFLMNEMNVNIFHKNKMGKDGLYYLCMNRVTPACQKTITLLLEKMNRRLKYDYS